MITAVFYNENGHLKGFKVSGHANSGEYGQDIVCAGVSSAVMLTMNTLTDFLMIKAAPNVSENTAEIRITAPDGQSDAVILSLEAHLRILAEKGGGKIRIIRKTYIGRE